LIKGLAVVSLQYYPILYKAKPEIADQFKEWAETLFGVKVFLCLLFNFIQI
jgi:hypothetical protein